MKAIEVTGLGITPVKGTRLRAVDSVRLGPGGVRENRRFFLINDKDEMVNATHLGGLNAIVSDYDDSNRHLSLEFPDGRLLAAEVLLGDELSARFYGEPAPARLVSGEWSDAISEYVGQPLRLVEAGEDGAVDRGAVGAMTLISRASLRRLAEQADQSRVDVRRFRMLIEVDGIEAHGEDAWVGRWVRVGQALVSFEGHVGRCLITSRDPDTGVVDLPTLDILREYRGDLDTTEPLPFGIYGSVVEPGPIRVGDPVTVDR